MLQGVLQGDGERVPILGTKAEILKAHEEQIDILRELHDTYYKSRLLSIECAIRSGEILHRIQQERVALYGKRPPKGMGFNDWVKNHIGYGTTSTWMYLNAYENRDALRAEIANNPDAPPKVRDLARRSMPKELPGKSSDAVKVIGIEYTDKERDTINAIVTDLTEHFGESETAKRKAIAYAERVVATKREKSSKSKRVTTNPDAKSKITAWVEPLTAQECRQYAQDDGIPVSQVASRALAIGLAAMKKKAARKKVARKPKKQ